MTELFGGFPRAFYTAYEDCQPLTHGYEGRSPARVPALSPASARKTSLGALMSTARKGRSEEHCAPDEQV